MQEYLGSGQDFAIETTLSGSWTTRAIKEALARRFFVRLVYICLDNPEQSIQRVHERVAQGGHNVPDDDVRRRYTRSLSNLRQVVSTTGASAKCARAQLVSSRTITRLDRHTLDDRRIKARKRCCPGNSPSLMPRPMRSFTRRSTACRNLIGPGSPKIVVPSETVTDSRTIVAKEPGGFRCPTPSESRQATGGV
jgi:hypothetical protein